MIHAKDRLFYYFSSEIMHFQININVVRNQLGHFIFLIHLPWVPNHIPELCEIFPFFLRDGLVPLQLNQFLHTETPFIDIFEI